MSNNVEEYVVYEGTKIRVDSLNMYEKEFEILEDQLVSQKTTYTPNLNIFLLADKCSEIVYYKYQVNIVFEKENNLTIKIFHL